MAENTALKVTQLDFGHWPALNFIPESSPEPPENPQIGQLWRSSVFDTISKYGFDLQWHLIISETELASALVDAGYATTTEVATAAQTAHDETQAVANALAAHANDHSAHGIPAGNIVTDSQLSPVAFTGDYASLTGKPDDDIPDLVILFENKLV